MSEVCAVDRSIRGGGASAMDHLDWYPGFELYKFYMKGRRLAARFTQAEIADNGFIALDAEIDPALLPRPPHARGFALHFSLVYMSSLEEHGVSKGIVRLLIDAINARYAGKTVSILLDRIGGGGAAIFDLDDPICLDPLLEFVYARGGLAGWKEPHISL